VKKGIISIRGIVLSDCEAFSDASSFFLFLEFLEEDQKLSVPL